MMLLLKEKKKESQERRIEKDLVVMEEIKNKDYTISKRKLMNLKVNL
jgi:hypothetical protein